MHTTWHLNLVDILFFLDFSLNDWMETNGYPLLAVLPLYAASQLLHDLDIIQYLGELSCNRKSVPFYPSKLGWNNGITYYQSVSLFYCLFVNNLNFGNTCTIWIWSTEINAVIELGSMHRVRFWLFFQETFHIFFMELVCWFGMLNNI